MIGWGWVVTTDLWITEDGSMGSIIDFLIGGLLVRLVGLTYAEFAAAMALGGGELISRFQALGRFASYVTTWALILGYVSVVAFDAVGLPIFFECGIPNCSTGHMYAIGGWDVTDTWAGIGMLGFL